MLHAVITITIHVALILCSYIIIYVYIFLLLFLCSCFFCNLEWQINVLFLFYLVFSFKQIDEVVINYFGSRYEFGPVDNPCRYRTERSVIAENLNGFWAI